MRLGIRSHIVAGLGVALLVAVASGCGPSKADEQLAMRVESAASKAEAAANKAEAAAKAAASAAQRAEAAATKAEQLFMKSTHK